MSGWGSIYNNTSYALAAQSELIAKLQEQASSGARVNRASDDPADAYQILRLSQQAQRYDLYSKNLESVISGLELGDTTLQQVSTSLTRAQSLVTQAASGTYTGDNRSVMGEEIDSLLEQMVSLANTKGMNGYIFGGNRSSAAPYEAQRVNGKIVKVQYQGAASEMPVGVADGVEFAGNMVGERVFGTTAGRQAPEFTGTTGAKVGSATSSIRGDAWLTVSHKLTTFAGLSQVSAGTSSVGGDTIIGGHTIAIVAADKTIKLDNGTAVSFVGDETNLEITNAAGDVVHLDMTGWTNASGDFAVTATGTLSLDDGATKIDIAAGANTAVTDPRSGEVLYVDDRQIVRAGTEAVHAVGTHNLFDALIHVRDVLLNGRSITSAQQDAMLHDSVESVQQVMDCVVRGSTAMGGRLQAMDDLRRSLENGKDSAESTADGLEQVDIVALATELSRVQNLYQMTLATASKLLNLSLLDYIR